MQTDLSSESSADDFRYAEQEWLAENKAKFPGEWLALQGSALVSHGKDIREVLADARRLGVQQSLMVFADPS